MGQDIVIGAIIIAPIVALLLLKSHAAVVFFSLCAGSVLVKYVGSDATLAATSLSSNEQPFTEGVVQIAVLILPAAVSTVLLRKSVGGTKLLTSIVPAVATGLLTALLVIPLLPAGTRSILYQSNLWSILEQFQDFIVLAGVISSLFVLWLANRKSGHGRRH